MFPSTLLVLCLLYFLSLVLSGGAAAESFADVTSLQGVLSAWAAPSFFFSSASERGCPGGFSLSAAGTRSSLTPTTCDTQADASFPYNLTAYSPMVGLMRADVSQAVYYSVLAPTTLLDASSPPSPTPSLLATFSSTSGAVLSLLPLPSALSPSALLLDASASRVYLLSLQLQAVSVAVVDPSQTSWAAALQSAFSVDLSSIAPAGSFLMLREAFRSSAFLPVSRRLLLLAGGASSASLSTEWQLLSIDASSGSWASVAFNDSSVLASSSLAFTALGESDTVLVSSDSAAWLVDFSDLPALALAVRMGSVDQHILRATAALGCGQIGVAVTVLPTTVPSANSSWPFVLLPMYAEPTPLSAIRAPFWYLLLLDVALDEATYVSINTPPLLLGQLTAMPVVSQLSDSAGALLAYNLTSGASLLWSGLGFDTGNYSCCTNSSCSAAAVLNSTALLCDLPPGLLDDIAAPTSSGQSGSLSLALVLDDAFVLYQSSLVVAASDASQYSVASTAALQAALARTVVAYSVALSLTPSPVISASADVSVFSAYPGQETPLQLHAHLTRGLTYVVQQLVNLSMVDPALTVGQVLPAVIAALAVVDWTESIGLSDAYALFASASQAAAAGSDFASMYASAEGALSQDPSSLPQTLTGLLSAGASSLSLDLLGAQVQDWLTDTIGSSAPPPDDLMSLLDLGVSLPPLTSNALSQLTSLALDAALQQCDSDPVLCSVLSDATVSRLLGLPEPLGELLLDPASLLAELLPAGAVKDVVSSLMAGGDSDGRVYFSGSPSDTLDGLLGGVQLSVSSLVGTVSTLGATFTDPLAADAVSFQGGALAGPVGSLAAVVTGSLGESLPVQELVTSAVSLAFGVAEVLCDNPAGIGSVVIGLGSLLGALFGGPSADELLSEEMTRDFNRVLSDLSTLSQQINTDTSAILSSLSSADSGIMAGEQQLSRQLNQGFGSLANLTVSGFTSLQQQQYAYYSSEMQGVSSVLQGVVSNSLSLSLATSLLQEMQTQQLQAEAQALLDYRDGLLNRLEAAMTAVQSALASSEAGFLLALAARAAAHQPAAVPGGAAVRLQLGDHRLGHQRSRPQHERRPGQPLLPRTADQPPAQLRPVRRPAARHRVAVPAAARPCPRCPRCPRRCPIPSPGPSLSTSGWRRGRPPCSLRRETRPTPASGRTGPPDSSCRATCAWQWQSPHCAPRPPSSPLQHRWCTTRSRPW